MTTLRTSQILALLPEFVPGFMAGSGEAGAFDGRRGGGVSPTPGTAVSVISIVGGLSGRSRWGADMGDLRALISDAADDSKIKSIVLDIDSPGGTVAGTPETAQVIRQAATVKPVIASVNGMAASAAYWMASNATSVMVSPSSLVGSIGVFATHTDWSVYDEAMGVKTSLIHAGKYKVEGNPYEPLDKEAAAEIQRGVDEAYEMFVADVAQGRGVSVAKVKADFGQGRMVGAVDAVRNGMADGIAPLEQVIASQLQEESKSAVKMAANAFAW